MEQITNNGLSVVENYGYWRAWITIIIVGLCTFIIRYAFLGLPEWRKLWKIFFAWFLPFHKNPGQHKPKNHAPNHKSNKPADKKKLEKQTDAHHTEIQREVSPFFKELLSYVPAAAFAGIAFPLLFLPGWNRYQAAEKTPLLEKISSMDGLWGQTFFLPIAASLFSAEGIGMLAALTIFLLSRSITLTIVVGISAYWWAASSVWFAVG